MRVQKYIKDFVFNDKTRANIVFSDPSLIRIVTGNLYEIANNNCFLGGIQLKYNSMGYSLANDIYAISRVSNPQALKNWRAVEEVSKKPTGTAIQYRLTDGTDQYWFNGTNWVVNTTNWNTFQDVSDNIIQFIPDSGGKSLGFVVNLSTMDKNLTPSLYGIRVMGEFDAFILDDVVYRSLVPMLNNIQFFADLGMIVPNAPPTTTTIDLSGVDFSPSEYNIAGVDSVFDELNDPGREINLFSSFNPNTKVVTLAAAVDADVPLFVRFLYKVRTSLNTDRDFKEIEKMPEMLIESMTAMNVRKVMYRDHLKRKADLEADVFEDSVTADYRFILRLIAPHGPQRLRMFETLRGQLKVGQIFSAAFDEFYDLNVVEEYSSQHSPSIQNRFDADLTFDIHNVTLWGDPVVKPLVGKVNISGAKQTEIPDAEIAFPFADHFGNWN